MNQLILLTVLFAFLTLPLFGETKPNIVFIMADDLGPGWVDYDDSNPEVNTPNLQRLAETGMIFTLSLIHISEPTRPY